jgi:hypothetical protein
MPMDGKSSHGLTGIGGPDMTVGRAASVVRIAPQGKSEFAQL